MQTHEYDLVVVGAGSGGYAAARTARDLGASVALVDRGPLGGLCILRGCMPSKALLASSDGMHDARNADALGIRIAGEITADMPFIAARKRGLVKEFADYRIEGIERFPVYMGDARFLSPYDLQAGDTLLRAKRFIIATGSISAPALVPGLEEAGYLDTDDVLELEAIPRSVVVLGGGYTACELGQFLSRMGAQTTMLIRSGHLLTETDDDVGDALTGYFRDEGIDVIARATLERVTVERGKKVVHFTCGGEARRVETDEIFHALGRIPNVEGLGLEAAGVAYDARNGIGVDLALRTTNPDIYAVGDVTGDYPLVHVAIYQGEIAARNAIKGVDERADYRIVSAHTIFTDPQIAFVGMNEKTLKHEGGAYVTGRYDFAEHGKAMCLNKMQGFVKMMADSTTGEILGAGIIGPQASELIHEVIVAMNYHSTVDEFMRIPHLHPTLAEIWTYPAEECAAQMGTRDASDQMIEVATSGTAH